MFYDGAALAGLIGEKASKLRITVLRDCTSTNDVVQDYFRYPDASDTVLALTDVQHSGQGRQGRAWISPAGKDVLMTLGLKRGSLIVPLDSRLPLAACVLVARGIEKATGVRLQTKWPNDLVNADGRKACGILLRNRATHFAIGVGINVNSLPQDYPEVLRSGISTLRELSGREQGRPAVAAAVVRELLDFFKAFTGDTLENLIGQWSAHTATFSLPMFLHQDGDVIEVTPLHLISETGELLVKHEDGREEVLSSAALIEA